MEETPLDVLERITPTLSDIGRRIILDNDLDTSFEVYAEDGESLLWGLVNDGELAIAKGFMSAGTTFPEHKHADIHEYGIILDGSVVVTLGDEQITLATSESIHIRPDTAHSIFAEVDTWYVAITIPADEAFPNVPKS